MPDTPTREEWMSLAKARELLGVSSPTLKRLIDTGRIGSRAVPGARPRVRRNDVVALLAQSTRSVAEPRPNTQA